MDNYIYKTGNKNAKITDESFLVSHRIFIVVFGEAQHEIRSTSTHAAVFAVWTHKGRRNKSFVGLAGVASENGTLDD